MGLTSGQQIGNYRIDHLIGAGGMGEVYRARDTKLGRDVAIKVLPRDLAADRERLARFAREAQVLATLNHPHIGAIYGLEEAAASRRWCSNWWKARRWRIACRRAHCRSPTALRIAHEIADALEPRTRKASSIAISSRQTS